MSAWFERFDTQCSRILPQLPVLREEPMRAHTTFRIGGNARRMARVRSEEELSALLTLVHDEGYPYLLLGNGSNLLVSDAGINALLIHTGEMQQIERVDENTLYAQAGVPLAKLAVFAMKHSLTGLEFAHGIPGTLGGAVCMNAGAYGGDMSTVVKKAASLTANLALVYRNVENMGLAYRKSIYEENGEIVTAVVFKLELGDKEKIAAEMETIMAKRIKSQPLDYPSAGSTFKRPEGYYAAALIDECGLKGLSVGGAEVSKKHAGFVINYNKATTDDILKLIQHIQKTVYKADGILLKTEVLFVGRVIDSELLPYKAAEEIKI